MKFKLSPFRSNAEVISLTGEMNISKGMIDIEFLISGKLRGLSWPDNGTEPQREHGLWEHTCFEFFIGSVASTSYHEVNLSPSGNWNCFSFTDVREGMKESETLTLRTFDSHKSDQNANLRATLDFKRLRPDSLRIGISAVIEMNTRLHYYALSHGETPDFHARQHHALMHPESS
jgi:hypothetical protein